MNNNLYNLTSGMDVEASDGANVGKVHEVLDQHLVVSKGFFFPQDYYIPFSAINSADGGTVYLNVTKDQALNQGWDAIPDTTNQVHTDQPVVGRTTDTGRLETDDKIDVTLSEEELTARTREVERGQVRVDKDVIVEDQTLDVPVTEERVHVSRRVVDRDVLPGDTTFEEGTIEVPVYGEEVELEKRSRVREEVEISKDAVQDVERVSGTVRHEEVRVTDESGAIIDDDTSTRSRR